MIEAATTYPRRFASLVKIEHTVFALPFAYVGAFLSVDAWPGVANVVWITVAMVGARTLAMSLNLMQRLTDRDLNQLSVDRNVPEPLRVAARKRVLDATSKR